MREINGFPFSKPTPVPANASPPLLFLPPSLLLTLVFFFFSQNLNLLLPCYLRLSSRRRTSPFTLSSYAFVNSPTTGRAGNEGDT